MRPLYADRHRLFEDVPANRRFIRRVMGWCLALGVVGTVLVRYIPGALHADGAFARSAALVLAGQFRQSHSEREAASVGSSAAQHQGRLHRLT